jgi:hypothetical protein
VSSRSTINKFRQKKSVLSKIYNAINVPVVLYGRETWSLSLREEQRLRVFENRVFRRIFGPKRDDVTGGSRELHNEELHNLYSIRNIIIMIKSRKIRWAGRVARVGGEEKCIWDIGGKARSKETTRKFKTYGDA